MYLVDGVDDPVDPGIAADGLVLGVDKDDLVVLVGGVLVDPVRVEDTEIGAASSDSFLSSRLERALVLELVYTVGGRLAYGSAKKSVRGGNCQSHKNSNEKFGCIP